MTNPGGKSAFPVISGHGILSTGLTKREYFAAAALQGLLLKVETSENFTGKITPQIITEIAVNCADALIDELCVNQEKRRTEREESKESARKWLERIGKGKGSENDDNN